MGIDFKRFVELPDSLAENLKCSLCLKIIESAINSECGHTFCKPCVYRQTIGSVLKECPKCQKSLTSRKRPKYFTNNETEVLINGYLFARNPAIDAIIGDLPVRCDFESLGCHHSLRLRQMSDHMKECLFNLCKNCGFPVGDEERHDCFQLMKKDRNLLKQKTNELIDEKQRLEEGVKKFKEDKQMSQQFNDLKNETKKLKQELKVVEKDYVFKSEYENCLKKNKLLETKVNCLQLDLKTKNDSIINIKKQANDMIEGTVDLQKEVSVLQNNWNKESKELKKRVSSLEKDIEIKNNEIQEMSENNEKKIKDLNEENNSRVKSLEETRDQQMKEMADKLESEVIKFNELKQMFDQNENMIQSLREDINRLEGKAEVTKYEVKPEVKEELDLKVKTEDLFDVKLEENIKLEENESNHQLIGLKAQNTRLREQVSTITRKLNELQKNYNDLIIYKNNKVEEEYEKLRNTLFVSPERKDPSLQAKHQLLLNKELVQFFSGQQTRLNRWGPNSDGGQQLETDSVLFAHRCEHLCTVELAHFGVTFSSDLFNEKLVLKFDSIEKICFCLESTLPVVAFWAKRTEGSKTVVTPERRKRLRGRSSPRRSNPSTHPSNQWIDLSSGDLKDRLIVIKLIPDLMQISDWISIIYYPFKEKPDLQFEIFDTTQIQEMWERALNG